jgi:hypothetical protein
MLAVDNIAANSASTNEFISNTAQIANLIVTNAKINDLAVSKLTAGSITSKAITLAVASGTGDVKIQAGKTDFGQDSTTGFILGIDDSDSDKVKFELTGGRIQTSGSGQRCILDSSDNTLKFYDSGAQVLGLGTLAANVVDIDLTSTTNNGIRIDSAVSGYGYRYLNNTAIDNTGLYIAMPSSNDSLDNNYSAMWVKYGGNDYILRGEAYGNLAGGIYLFRTVGVGSNSLIRLYEDTANDSPMVNIDKGYTGNLNGPIVSITNSSYGIALQIENDNISSDQPTVNIINSSSSISSPALFINKDGAGYAVDIDQDCNTATNTIGIHMNIANAGAGVEFAFEFAGSEYIASATGVSGLTGVIKVLTSDGTGYIPIYGTAS